MTKEIKDLITSGMLEDVLDLYEVLDFYEEGDDAAPYFEDHYEIAFTYFKTEKDVDVQDDDSSNHLKDKALTFYELKDKLEEWICKNTLSYDAGFDVSDKMWTMEIWWKSDPYNKCMGWESQSKLEALLKLYHAIKATR